MQGVGVAKELIACFLYRVSGWKTFTWKSSRPVLKSVQTANISFPFRVAVVYQIWSPKTTGEDHPLPSMATFHSMFRVSDQLTGTDFSLEIPSRLFPRKWVHSPLPEGDWQEGIRLRRARERNKMEKSGRMMLMDFKDADKIKNISIHATIARWLASSS
jgi:hypothetical protein